MSQRLMDALEDEAFECVKELRAARIYSGKLDSDKKHRSRMALGTVVNYVRLKAVIAHERTNDIAAERLLRESPAIPVRALTE